VTTLYTYNDRGERRDTAIDMDQDGAIDYDGADRITRATSEVRAARGTSVRRTQTYEWRTDGTDASTLVNTMDVSVNGLDSWSESFGRTSHSQTVYNRATATRTVTTTAPDGSHGVTEYQNGRLVSVTRYDAADTQLGQTMYAYDAHGRQQSVTDARTGATLFTYDDADQVATVTSPDPDGAGTQTAQVTSYTYDVRGRTSQVTLPDSGIVNHSYWPTGELRKTWGTRVYPTESTYDAQGRLQTLTTWKDYAGNGGEAVTTWNYNDDRGWLDSKHYADGKGPSYTHSTGGRLLSRAWARLAPGNQQLTTAYSYNGAGDPVGIDYSDSTPDVTFGYDRAGRAVTITDAAGTQTLAYTEDSQLDAATYAAGGLLAGISLDAGFDILGRRTSLAWSATAGSGSTAYAYDAASRLATVSSGAVSFAYGYLPNSDLVATVTASNGTQDVMDTNRAYDQISRLTAITSTRLLAPTDTLTSFTYAYNAANQRIQSTLADGSYWIYEYDALGQVTSAVKHWAGGAPVAGQTFGYAFDDIGNRETAMEGEAPSHASAYSANALNQYTQRTVPALVAVRGEAEAAATVTVTVGAPAPAGTTYPADRYGRSFRALVPVGNTESAVWQDLQIVGVRPGAGPEGKDMVSEQAGYAFVPESPEAFTHDDDGNLLSDGRWQYTWDAENRLVAMETRTNLPASIPRLRLELAYDSQSRRVRKKVYSWTGAAWSTSSDTRFVYDGWNLLAEIDSTGAPLRSYVWGLDLSGSLQGAGGIGGLLCITQHSTPATRHLPSYDGNGNLVVLVDAATGAPVAQYEYDPFGNPLRVTGASAGTNPFRFSTKYTDAETGLVYYGYRYLNTGTGRWLNRDPLEEGGGVSLYGLCGNAPVAAADALGLERRWSGGYEVTGTGHHVFPVELWRDFGFPDSVKPILDQATISVDPGRLHNSYAHGRINGYTGYVTVYANDVMAKWLTERGLTGRHLIQCQYEELAQLLVAKLQPASCTDEFIRGFNARVHSPGRLTDWYERAGSRLPRVAEEARTLRKLPGSARVATSRVREVLGRAMDIGRRIPGLEYILAATALWSYSARGDSGEDAAMKTVLDTLLPVVSVADIEDAGAAVFADPYEGAAGVGQGQFSGGQGGVWGDVARNRRQVLDLENQ
jgi:RHS repeat-associated protein